MKPKHFQTARRFQIYILTCAIRDRLTFADAMTPDWGKPDEETQKQLDETNAEIEVMQKMQKKLRDA